MMVATSRPLSTRLGRHELRQPLGKSGLTMTWLAAEAASGQDATVCMPRTPLAGEDFEIWMQRVNLAARLRHPRLVQPDHIGDQDHWPYAVYPRPGWTTLGERLVQGSAPGPADVAQWMCEVLEALAYLHEAGQAHLDVGLHTIVFDAQGKAALIGAGVANWPPPAPPGSGADSGHATLDRVRAGREAAERDLLMLGLVMHRLLAGHPALDDPDVASAADRVGREIVRLPWTTPHPVPEALRAIVNRATDRQARQRYLSARSLLRALHGWIEVNSQDSGGPLGLLLDRLQSVGHLPGRPGLAQSVKRLAQMEGQRLDEMVDQIVQDPALVCELLRHVNSAHFIGHGDGPVTSVRRAVLLIGLGGVQSTASSLRSWPGALTGGDASAAAQSLEVALRRACVAGQAAAILCPPGNDEQEALIAGMFQQLGRLLVLYHFPDEAAQIARLMQSVPPPEPGGKETPGMSEEAAAGAVLGVDLESLGVAVARHWGLDDGIIHAMRPYGPDAIVRRPDDREDRLRALASLANEALAASQLPAQKQAAAFTKIVQRYGRALDVTLREIQGALADARRLVGQTGVPAETVPGA